MDTRTNYFYNYNKEYYFTLKKNYTLKLLLSGTMLSGTMVCAQNHERPNIIYVLADQLRADALGYTGNNKAITPNIDKFSNQSVNFSNAIAVTPVSAAYRASLFTGKYNSSTGMIINEINMNPNHRTWEHVLGDADYNLGYIGKMHLNDRHTRSYKKGPERMGWDGYWAAYSFNHQSFDAYYYTDSDDGSETHVDLKGQYGPEVFTGLALDYIRDASHSEKPFALFLSWNPPHDPWVKENVPLHCYDRFENAKFELPPNFKENPDPYMDRYPQEFFDGESSWREEFIGGGGYQETMRCYYAMVNSLDEQFGRITSLIDSLGIADNTIVIFTSDHGEMFASQGRMYKLTFYDEACRVPFLLRYPAQNTGGESDVCINTPDIGPTLLGLAGLGKKIPEEMEGMDLSHVIYKQKGIEPDFAFMQGMGHTYQWKDGYEWRAVRDKRYTYAVYLRDGTEAFFDRESDPFMKNNLINDRNYSTQLNVSRKQMKNKMEELNDEFNPCTWYRDNWMYKDYSIKAGARGEFGPLPPIEPERR